MVGDSSDGNRLEKWELEVRAETEGNAPHPSFRLK